jgi:hypothetical protein
MWKPYFMPFMRRKSNNNTIRITDCYLRITKRYKKKLDFISTKPNSKEIETDQGISLNVQSPDSWSVQLPGLCI